MSRSIRIMWSLIKSGNLYIEEFSKRPLLPEDLEYSTGNYRQATSRDMKYFADSRAWFEMLASGRAFFAGRD